MCDLSSIVNCFSVEGRGDVALSGFWLLSASYIDLRNRYSSDPVSKSSEFSACSNNCTASYDYVLN